MIFINFQKIIQLQNANKDNESIISELKAKVIQTGNVSGERTPLKPTHANVTLNTPKTPRTPKTPLFGKENQSPSTLLTTAGTMSPGIVRIRNN